MENRSYAVGVGLFVLLLIALLIGGILWFDERGHLRGVPYEFLEQLKEQPQSVLFGAQPRPPGPGERGFTPPRISQ